MSSDEIYCLKKICAEDKEEEAINFLFKSLSEKYKEALRKESEYGAIIRAVKAINNGKNESIDALCDNEKGFLVRKHIHCAIS